VKKTKLKLAKILAAFIISAALLPHPFALAQSGTHTVVKGDTMWKIAVKYQIGLSELIKANPQIKDPSLIYPGQKITIPNIDDVKALEAQVVRLVTPSAQSAGSLRSSTTGSFRGWRATSLRT